jgi:choline-sulfatase
VARAQARELSALDRMLTELLAGLDALGQLADTVVLFTSDNGLNYGEDRMPAVGIVKNDFSEASLRVPMVCLGPGFTPGDSPAQVSADVDVNATIVAITGCEAQVGLPAQRGLDLRSLQGTPAARPLLHERTGGGVLDFIDHSGVAVSTESRKLMRWYDADPADEYELYDLVADPLELVNLAADPAYAGDLASLQAVLDGLLA